MPTALPISRLISSPCRKVSTFSPPVAALSATLANAARMIARSAETVSDRLAVSLKRFSAPTLR
jgi:hypothetical protein